MLFILKGGSAKITLKFVNFEIFKKKFDSDVLKNYTIFQIVNHYSLKHA